MESIVITPAMMADANTYIPMAGKLELIAQIVPLCLSRVAVSYASNEGANPEPLPDRCQCDNKMVSLCLMSVLARAYLKQDFDLGGDDAQAGWALYDLWAGSHVMNQLERMKGSKEIGSRVYDLLYDYKDFKWALLREIDAMVSHRNDVVTRLNQAMSAQITPDSMGALLEQIAAVGTGGEKEAMADDA